MVVDTSQSTPCSSHGPKILTKTRCLISSQDVRTRTGSKKLLMKSSSKSIAVVTTILLISLFSTCNAAREWETRQHNYTVSAEPYFVPYISEIFGRIIPFPEAVFNFQPIVAKPLDFFVSKPKEDWTAYQPMWLVSIFL